MYYVCSIYTYMCTHVYIHTVHVFQKLLMHNLCITSMVHVMYCTHTIIQTLRSELQMQSLGEAVAWRLALDSVLLGQHS